MTARGWGVHLLAAGLALACAGGGAPPAPTDPPTSPEPSKKSAREYCPAPGESVTLRGKVLRIIDNDSFEFQSGPWTYIVYVGTATRMGRGGKKPRVSDFRENQALEVRGTVAAGPDDECSVGANQIEVRR